ncbi:hypothetical protein PUN28_011964 [Cardiocondyla obscurior]|uniref:Uncharacterized protein n=1 Tax=Cardiocondyla obscurior TaxID=286306 RepID=A0AAW2FDN8_9HYME
MNQELLKPRDIGHKRRAYTPTATPTLFRLNHRFFKIKKKLSLSFNHLLSSHFSTHNYLISCITVFFLICMHLLFTYIIILTEVSLLPSESR